MYDGWGMTPTKCYEWIQKNGGKAKYPIFGVQVRFFKMVFERAFT